jgi:alginate O-acetyltransferase complex protein AlgI
MVFSSISFLYYFLPLMLASYFIAPEKYKNSVLCFGSLIFYAIGEPKYILILLISIAIDYVLSLYIENHPQSKKATFAMILSIIMNLSLLAFFKYINFFLSLFTSILGMEVVNLPISLPIGISFFTFQTMSYTLDVYSGRAKAQKSFIAMATYVTMFPQLIAGPIVRYQTVSEEITLRSISPKEFSEGISRFLAGMAKKVLLANTLGELYVLLESQTTSLLSLWLMAIAFMLQIYFDFSGYSDMAIGLGRMFGFHFPENFNYPYCAKSITDFWRRWHMSLGTWFRDYVYIPLGGNRVQFHRVIFNILFVWFLTGLWHGANWNYIVWGLYFGCILLAEKYLKLQTPRIFSHLYVLLVVLFGFVLFKHESIDLLQKHLLGMVGLMNIPLISFETLYTLRSFIILLFLGILFSTPLPKRTLLRFTKSLPPSSILVLQLAVLLIITAYLVDASYNPFLYFRF